MLPAAAAIVFLLLRYYCASRFKEVRGGKVFFTPGFGRDQICRPAHFCCLSIAVHSLPPYASPRVHRIPAHLARRALKGMHGCPCWILLCHDTRTAASDGGVWCWCMPAPRSTRAAAGGGGAVHSSGTTRVHQTFIYHGSNDVSSPTPKPLQQLALTESQPVWIATPLRRSNKHYAPAGSSYGFKFWATAWGLKCSDWTSAGAAAGRRGSAPGIRHQQAPGVPVPYLPAPAAAPSPALSSLPAGMSAVSSLVGQ